MQAQDVTRSSGNTDRLLDFSEAVTGTLFFIQSFYLLDKIADGEIMP